MDISAQQPRALHERTRDQSDAMIASIATDAKLASIAVVTRPYTHCIHVPSTATDQDNNYRIRVNTTRYATI